MGERNESEEVSYAMRSGAHVGTRTLEIEGKAYVKAEKELRFSFYTPKL